MWLKFTCVWSKVKFAAIVVDNSRFSESRVGWAPIGATNTSKANFKIAFTRQQQRQRINNSYDAFSNENPAIFAYFSLMFLTFFHVQSYSVISILNFDSQLPRAILLISSLFSKHSVSLFRTMHKSPVNGFNRFNSNNCAHVRHENVIEFQTEFQCSGKSNFQARILILTGWGVDFADEGRGWGRGFASL